MVRPSGANRANVIEPRLNVSGSKLGVVVLLVDRPARKSAAPAATSDCGGRREPQPAPAAWRRRVGHALARQAGQRLNVERDVACRLEALLRVLLEAVQDDPVERGRQRLAPLGGRRGVLLEDRVHRLDGRVALERAASRQHLVEHDAEREDVGAVIDGLPAHLLGRHVPHRAEHRARAGQRTRVGEQRRLGLERRAGRGQLGEAEVEDLDAAVARHEDVVRLQVAVDDPLVVRGRQPARDLAGVVDGLPMRQRRCADARAERLPIEQFRDDVRRAVVGADVVDAEDVGVIERADRARLLLEAAEAIAVGRERRRQHLDGDVPAEACVARAVDFAHAARPDRGQDFVRTHASAGRHRHRCISYMLLVRVRVIGGGSMTLLIRSAEARAQRCEDGADAGDSARRWHDRARDAGGGVRADRRRLWA